MKKYRALHSLRVLLTLARSHDTGIPTLAGAAVEVESIGLNDAAFMALCRDRDGWFAAWLGLWRSMPAERQVAWSHPTWLLAWLDTYARASGHDYRVCFVSRGATLTAVFALRVVAPALPVFGGQRLELIDDSVLYGADPLLADREPREVVEALLRAVEPSRGVRRLMLLRTVDAGSPLLAPGMPSFGVAHVQRALIRLGTDHETFLASLGKNLRGNLRKARNRLKAAGESSLLCLRAPEEMAAGLKRFAAVEARSWKGRAGSTMGGTAQIMHLYERSLTDLATLGQSAVHVLTLNGEDIAAMISHVSDTTLFAFKIGYDERFAELSPGHLLIEAVMRDFCRTQGITTMHLLTDERWFDSWRPERVQTFEVYVTEGGIRGAISRLLGVPVRKRVKRLLQSYRGAATS